MKKTFLIVMIIILVIIVGGCGVKLKLNKDIVENEELKSVNITVGAAASLTDALTEIEALFEDQHNITIDLSFASSGKLQKQIEEGAPIDLFISAAMDKMDILENRGLIDEDSRENLFENDLVMLISDEYKNEIQDVKALIDSDVMISIGEPETVPAGKYAKEALKNLQIWDKLEQENIVLAKDVSQVLTYVEQGEVAAGIVYSSDAKRASSGTIGYEFDDKTHTPIVYPAALVAESTNKEAGQVFLDYLKTEEAQKILEKYGFLTYTE